WREFFGRFRGERGEGASQMHLRQLSSGELPARANLFPCLAQRSLLRGFAAFRGTPREAPLARMVPVGAALQKQQPALRRDDRNARPRNHLASVCALQHAFGFTCGSSAKTCGSALLSCRYNPHTPASKNAQFSQRTARATNPASAVRSSPRGAPDVALGPCT